MANTRRRYEVPASETEEGQKRQAEYWTALGCFVDMFSTAESAMQYTLRHYAKVNEQIGQVVFSGTRVDAAMGRVKRLLESTNARQELQDEISYLFQQLSVINGARNEIIHHGAHAIAEGRGAVTNALTHLPARTTTFPISPQLLEDMTADLRKIAVHLHLHHMGRSPLRGTLPDMLDVIVRSTWRYKHSAQSLPPKPTEARTRRSRKREGG